ncbi:hypothetical protein A3K86_21320 [Photobacterium jeanii]|uniref:Uncharacterized protein n=2 Tax=Photobacterium jeanii TaxID=858640 RepID=A0A178K363_9GAMM|nr:hypothetical protein A3K86_21320 [Photobacterium jeanii]PST91258.1 WYL domain-containing protein [Photobacterium jeanii]
MGHYSNDKINRFRLIEIIALWEGRLTTNHLQNCFEIGRQQASKDINTYITEIAPNNLEYDKSLKGYKPSSSFVPVLTDGRAEDYLLLLGMNQRLVSKGSHIGWGFNNVATVSSPPRNIKPEVIQSIVSAITHQQRLEIEYVSLYNPMPETRVIAPHTLVQTPLRWHVRAYCEKNRQYRDFVLSRFCGEPECIGKSEHGIADDENWHSVIELELIADPRLNDKQRQLVALDYGMQDNVLIHKTSVALLHYDLSCLNLSLSESRELPEYQQLAIRNINQIKMQLNNI